MDHYSNTVASFYFRCLAIVRITNLPSQQEAFYGREVIEADRELVESGSDEILAGADKTDIAFLVVGDPFGYTSHTIAQFHQAKLTIHPAQQHTQTLSSAPAN